MRVLIATTSSADNRKTLAAVRALGRQGVHVRVGCDRRANPASLSKYCRRGFSYPNPVDDADGFVESLLREVERGGYDVLLPLSDYTTMTIAQHRDSFESHVGIPIPAFDSIRRAHDKLEAQRLAERLGIAVPATWCPANAAELDRLAKRLQYPCVFKLRKGAGAVGLRFPASADELRRCYAQPGTRSDLVYDHARPLIQEFIPGEVHDVCLLMHDGEPRAALTQRRLRMYPSRGGVGIFNETTDEPALRDQAIALLQELRWHGPALVEFKIDTRDGRARMLEINSRYWGTLDLAIQAGVNFPLLACRMAMEGDVEPVFAYRKGLRYRWPLHHGLRYAWDSGRFFAELWEFIAPRSRTRSDLWLSDPLPSLALLAGRS